LPRISHRWIGPFAIALVALVVATSASAGVPGATKPVGWGPLRDHQAANRVERSSFEPRPDNRAANHTVPGKHRLERWRHRSDMPYARFVDGRFRGTTDEIIQWAAHKWGFPPNLLRAVAVTESYWHQSAVGDNGDSFGLFQVRRPYHCWGACRIARYSTAFNADYYGAILRAYYDGKQKWLNTVERGRRYHAGDVWGSVGAWFSGRWWTDPSRGYIRTVKHNLAARIWRQPDF
jgi:hypothetical protein